MRKDTVDLTSTPVRSGTGIRLAIIILGLVGAWISSYLTYVHYRGLNAVCFFGADCHSVLTSRYAQVLRVPLSLLGIVIYTALTVLGILGLVNRTDRWNLIATSIYALSLSGTLFSVYLYYLEIFQIHAFCTLCIASSIVMFSIFILSLINLRDDGFDFKQYQLWIKVILPKYIRR